MPSGISGGHKGHVLYCQEPDTAKGISNGYNQGINPLLAPNPVITEAVCRKGVRDIVHQKQRQGNQAVNCLIRFKGPGRKGPEAEVRGKEIICQEYKSISCKRSDYPQQDRLCKCALRKDDSPFPSINPVILSIEPVIPEHDQ